MNTFTYEGLEFKPLKNLKGKASDFNEISMRIKDIGITPEGWNYNKFYELAKANNAEVDLFEVNGRVAIPAQNYLFRYN